MSRLSPNVRFWGSSGHDADLMQCLLLTQSGHRRVSASNCVDLVGIVKDSGLLPCARLDDKMRGPANTKIKLTIMRKGSDKPLEITIVRDIIRVKSVRYPLGMIA